MFDLDGTLADTLDAIAAAGNHALTRLGRRALVTDQYRQLIGRGVQRLMTKALGDDSLELVPESVRLFRQYYNRHGDAQTRLYEGVPQLLASLKQRKMKRAVLSNKPHDATQTCVATVLAGHTFEAVAGAKPDIPLKPNPVAALTIVRQLKIAPDRWLYVGDSQVDMITANAAGMYAVGALWGFRDEAELRDGGAKALIGQPLDFLPLLDGFNLGSGD